MSIRNPALPFFLSTDEVNTRARGNGNKKIFEKLRKLEVFYISTILNIEKIRNRILCKEPEKISTYLLSFTDDENIFIINKKQKKIKKETIVNYLREGKLEKVLDIVHFPSRLTLKAGEMFLDREDADCLKEITEDEKNAVEIITAMHYPMILDAVSMKIKQNAFFVKYEYDLINEGFLGILEAVYKFDVSKGNKFITYATPWVNYRINQFVKKALKDIDSRNGNHKRHIFKDKIFQCDSHIEDFKNKIYDYDFPLPLAYLFPKLKFEKINTLKSNLNMILSNHSYTKRIINYCKNNGEFAEIIMDYPHKPEIAARLIMEELFPYMVRMKKTAVKNTEEEFGNNQFYSVKEDDPHTSYEKENMLDIIMKEATEEEREKIEMFLNEDISLKKIEPVLNRIKERLMEKGFID